MLEILSEKNVYTHLYAPKKVAQLKEETLK